MPLYEYECKENGHRFEAIQNLNDKPLKTCRHCKSKVQRLISSSGFVLKGAGFYVNDYATGKSGQTTSGEKKAKETPACSSGACAKNNK